MNMSSQIHQRIRSQTVPPKLGESNRGQRITAHREKLAAGGQAYRKGADQGLDLGMDELKTQLWGQLYGSSGSLELYLQEAPLARILRSCLQLLVGQGEESTSNCDWYFALFNKGLFSRKTI